jgi:hypothetical protein
MKCLRIRLFGCLDQVTIERAEKSNLNPEYVMNKLREQSKRQRQTTTTRQYYADVKSWLALSECSSKERKSQVRMETQSDTNKSKKPPMLSPAQLMASLSEEERTALLSSLDPSVKAQLKYHWPFWARPNQLPPKETGLLGYFLQDEASANLAAEQSGLMKRLKRTPDAVLLS